MDLVVQKRDVFGKPVQALRRKGFIPAELYGHGVQNLHLAVPSKEFRKVFKAAGESTMITVVLDRERRPAMIHDVSYHPVTDEIVSVDFYEVRLDEKIRVKVPIRFTGEAPAVKEKGGLLVKAMSEVEVEALPGNLPPAIEANLGGLKEIGQSLYVKDLPVSDTIKVLVQPETVIVSVVAKMTEEQEKALEATAGAVESVKVETEEKKAERAAKQATETPAPEEKK